MYQDESGNTMMNIDELEKLDELTRIRKIKVNFKNLINKMNCEIKINRDKLGKAR